MTGSVGLEVAYTYIHNRLLINKESTFTLMSPSISLDLPISHVYMLIILLSLAFFTSSVTDCISSAFLHNLNVSSLSLILQAYCCFYKHKISKRRCELTDDVHERSVPQIVHCVALGGGDVH